MTADLANTYKAVLTTESPLDPGDAISNFIFCKMEKLHFKSNEILREEIKTAGKILREEKQCWVTGRLGGRKQKTQADFGASSLKGVNYHPFPNDHGLPFVLFHYSQPKKRTEEVNKEYRLCTASGDQQNKKMQLESSRKHKDVAEARFTRVY
ncbi:hypothetical protein Anapl_16897 [Anas platyrhynchos]|uniref:Uncharacterized protein n=1 Tax=Anas platyrhynchos TaxID=8839 RepID=R0L637_ANAPL|nr:hypothetical protein Anapl_16897 [Anas platyrhynchos]